MTIQTHGVYTTEQSFPHESAKHKKRNILKQVSKNIIASSSMLATNLVVLTSQHFDLQEKRVATENVLQQASELSKSFSPLFIKDFLAPSLVLKAVSMIGIVVAKASEALMTNHIPTVPEVKPSSAILSGTLELGQLVINDPEIQDTAKKMLRSASGKFKQIKRSSSSRF